MGTFFFFQNAREKRQGQYHLRFFPKYFFPHMAKVNSNGEIYPVGIYIPYWAASFAANVLIAQITEVRK